MREELSAGLHQAVLRQGGNIDDNHHDGSKNPEVTTDPEAARLRWVVPPFPLMPPAFSERGKLALEAFDRLNSEDPRTQIVGDLQIPRELFFSRKVFDWVLRLRPDAPEELLLAARGHTLRRWMIPRDMYPKTRVGYHQWRRALALYHADQADEVLSRLGFPESVRERIRALVDRRLFPADPDSQTLEDADCLAFLETKLHEYIQDWGEEKTIDILKKTLKKMTPRAKELAATLSLSVQALDLLRRAMAKQ